MDGYGAAAYGDAFADVYDEWYRDISDVGATVDCIVRLADGGPVLELGIGTGRLALPLADRGVSVAGIDASPAMVAELRRKPGGGAIEVTIADMSEQLPDGPFALVFAAFNTFFNLPSADAQLRCLGLVASRLHAEGCFVVEAFVPEDPSHSGTEPADDRVEVRHVTAERVVLGVSRVWTGEQRAEGHFIDIGPGGVRLRPWAIRYATPEELDDLATAVGLALTDRWADWRRTPFSPDSRQHVSVYRLVRGRAT